METCTLLQELLPLKSQGEAINMISPTASLFIIFRTILTNAPILHFVFYNSGPKIPFRLGRTDADSGETSPKECGLPDADKGSSQCTRSHVRDVFYRKLWHVLDLFTRISSFHVSFPGVKIYRVSQHGDSTASIH